MGGLEGPARNRQSIAYHICVNGQRGHRSVHLYHDCECHSAPQHCEREDTYKGLEPQSVLRVQVVVAIQLMHRHSVQPEAQMLSANMSLWSESTHITPRNVPMRSAPNESADSVGSGKTRGPGAPVVSLACPDIELEGNGG